MRYNRCNILSMCGAVRGGQAPFLCNYTHLFAPPLATRATAARARDPRARSATANGGSDPRSRPARPRPAPATSAWRRAPATRSPWGWGGGGGGKGGANDKACDAPPRGASARNPTRDPLAARACDLRPAWDLPDATRRRPAHTCCPCDPPAARARDSRPRRRPACFAADSPVTYLPSQCPTSDLPVTYPVTYLAHPINSHTGRLRYSQIFLLGEDLY